MAAYMSGHPDAATEIWTRAHHAFSAAGDLQGAVRCAFWTGFGMVHHGQGAAANGWFSRARRLIDDANLDCVERGFLLVSEGMERFGVDVQAAYGLFCEAAEIGERFGDRDLLAIAGHGRGRALIYMGRAGGVTILDEAMIAVTGGEVSPVVAGTVYCGAIEAYQQEVVDIRRAREWTAAFTRWCESHSFVEIV
jgi:hypothetical protein